MTPTPTSTELRARIARREVLLWLGAFGWPLLRVLALGGVVGVACSLLLTEALGRMLADARSSEVALLGLRWGLALALAPALWAGLSSLALKLARGWALVPAFVLPAYVFAAAWLRSTELKG